MFPMQPSCCHVKLAGVCSMLVRGIFEQALPCSRAVQTQSSLIAERRQQMAWASG